MGEVKMREMSLKVQRTYTALAHQSCHTYKRPRASVRTRCRRRRLAGQTHLAMLDGCARYGVGVARKGSVDGRMAREVFLSYCSSPCACQWLPLADVGNDDAMIVAGRSGLGCVRTSSEQAGLDGHYSVARGSSGRCLSLEGRTNGRLGWGWRSVVVQLRPF